jgi:hypothetical protein
MTKVFALLSVAAVFAFASCADKKVEETAADTTAVVVPVADTTTTVDTTATVAPVDTVK